VKGDVAPETEEALAAEELLADIRRLRDQVQAERDELRAAAREKRLPRKLADDRLAELDEIDARLAALEDKTLARSARADERLASNADPRLRGMIQGDLERARALDDETRDLTGRIDAAVDKLSARELDRVYADLRRVLDKAKLGKIDSVIGEKRKYELEVEDLAKGRYPAELINKLYEQGLIGDDEEFWPDEGEVWEDEYEGWR
jgi:hypothetical protein